MSSTTCSRSQPKLDVEAALLEVADLEAPASSISAITGVSGPHQGPDATIQKQPSIWMYYLLCVESDRDTPTRVSELATSVLHPTSYSDIVTDSDSKLLKM